MMSHDLHLQPNNNLNTYDQPVGTIPDPQQQRSNPSEYIANKLKQSSHPTVLIFHLLFKGLALLFYLFGRSIFRFGHLTQTVVCILCIAADFWVVKNVTGRLLVGLRWWNKVENDTTTWIFEAATDKPVNRFDRSVFWTVLYGTPFMWTVFLLLQLIRFKVQWVLFLAIAISLSSANVYGYYRCSSDQKAQLQSYMAQGAQQGALTMMRGSMLSMLTGQQAVANQGNAGSNFV